MTEMRNRSTRPWQRIGIGVKIALLSWSVALLTLLIFVAAIIPEQKHIFLENLHSKGRGTAVSVQDVAAGALVTKDYSAVVDHCLLLLKGDPSLNYLVLVRMDGYALISDRSGWREGEVHESWRPAERKERSGIEARPLIGKRAFNYSSPFNYSAGIEWGWIHIGLSLDSYDRSVARVYYRTAVLALICVTIGALASIGYARRLVRPISSLQEVVRAVARGQLSARAEIRSGDEVESLANSFNGMTAALQHRNRILESVRFAAQELLSTDDWRTVIGEVLAKLAQAADVGSAYIFENHTGPDGEALFSQRYEWIAPGGSSSLDSARWQNLRWQGAGLDKWMEVFRRGEFASAHVRELGDAERAVIDPQVKSLIVMPILVRGVWWGLIGFDQWNREREWIDAERDSLKAAADMLGAAIERKRTQDALLEAKETLEKRVSDRTRELQEQVLAKERAHAELASTQQQLMDLSRQSGMAELATGVLHNVGNALNSVNVSATLVTDRLRTSQLGNLGRLAELLREHKENLAKFLTEDPKGRLVPDYLFDVCAELKREQGSVLEELSSLNCSVEHVKGIVAVQQAYAKVGGVIEMLPITAVVNDALKTVEASFSRHGIRVVREFEELPSQPLDRHQVLQILLNLLRNATEALKQAGQTAKVVTISVRRTEESRVLIRVHDNGVGIEPQTLGRLFSFGFTTKRDGHGFGLHLGAIAAQQMGGSLTAESGGLGRGAAFTLVLPLGSKAVGMTSR
ncbi:MAG: HAMP domain-containing protein [Verrucomicrobia bacterium]|nr:HAMP domain-containing protein [Verrucomicrobiota bacterium]